MVLLTGICHILCNSFSNIQPTLFLSHLLENCLVIQQGNTQPAHNFLGKFYYQNENSLRIA